MPIVDPSLIPSSWLREKLETRTIEGVLRHHLVGAQLIDVDIEQMIQDAVPKCREKWDHFTSDMLASDELWFFSNSEANWSSFSGRSGYAIVRNGKIIAADITAMS